MPSKSKRRVCFGSSRSRRSREGDEMLTTTLSHLRCPKSKCAGSEFKLVTNEMARLKDGAEDVLTGALVCPRCRGEYPILAGVAIVLEDPGSYLIAHVKGVAPRPRPEPLSQ